MRYNGDLKIELKMNDELRSIIKSNDDTVYLQLNVNAYTYHGNHIDPPDQDLGIKSIKYLNKDGMLTELDDVSDDLLDLIEDKAWACIEDLNNKAWDECTDDVLYGDN